MIVTSKMLTESLGTLGMEGLASWGAEELKGFYRDAARTAHPDAGGTDERWAAVDKAHAILKEHLRKQGGDVQPKLVAEKCANCTGSGYVEKKSQRGFNITTLRVQCRKCNGTGEEGVEHDRGDWG